MAFSRVRAKSLAGRYRKLSPEKFAPHAISTILRPQGMLVLSANTV